MTVWSIPVLTGTDANATQCFYIGSLPSIFWKKAFILPGRRPHVHANAASLQTGSSGLVKLVCLPVVTRERVQKKTRLCTVQTLASGISSLKLKQTTQPGYQSRHNLSETWKSENNLYRLPDTILSCSKWEMNPQKCTHIPGRRIHAQSAFYHGKKKTRKDLTDLHLWSPPVWACCAHRRLWWCTQPPWWNKWCLAWVLQWPFPKGRGGGKEDEKV